MLPPHFSNESHFSVALLNNGSMATEVKKPPFETSGTATCERTGCIHYYLKLSPSPVNQREYLGSQVLHFCPQGFAITLDLFYISLGSITGAHMNKQQNGNSARAKHKENFLRTATSKAVCSFSLYYPLSFFKSLMIPEVIRL